MGKLLKFFPIPTHEIPTQCPSHVDAFWRELINSLSSTYRTPTSPYHFPVTKNTTSAMQIIVDSVTCCSVILKTDTGCLIIEHVYSGMVSECTLHIGANSRYQKSASNNPRCTDGTITITPWRRVLLEKLTSKLCC